LIDDKKEEEKAEMICEDKKRFVFESKRLLFRNLQESFPDRKAEYWGGDV
jgi:hypothetical protein